MKKVVQRIKKIAFLTITLFLIIITSSTLANSQNIIMIDSIHYSKGDSFFGDMELDIFLSNKGVIYRNQMSKYSFIHKGKTIRKGRFEQTVIERQAIDSILSKSQQIYSADLKENYRINRSDQPTSYFFNNGKLLKSISDYGMQGTNSLANLYKALDNINANGNYNWIAWEIEGNNYPLINDIKVDSIAFVKHLKVDGEYYRNGIERKYVLKDEELEKFKLKALQIKSNIKYIENQYVASTNETNKYSMVIYYNNKVSEWIKYNGKRFIKNNYLNYKTNKDIARQYLFSF